MGKTIGGNWGRTPKAGSSDDDEHGRHDAFGGPGGKGGHGGPRTINGTKGNDVLYGTSGSDTIHGGSGNDALYGLGGSDNIDGGKGNDLIDGGAGNDRLAGNDGNDILIGGAGDDYIDGGPHGNDIARYAGNYADYRITRSRGDDDHGGCADQGFVITVKDLRPHSPDGTDTLRRIEVIVFADRTIYIDGRNNPAAIGTPTVSSLVEDVNVNGGGDLTATGTISIWDADAGQSSFRTTVIGIGAPLGTLVLATDGAYTYTVANSEVQYLGAGATRTDTFRIASADGTTKDVSFTITGTNDAPMVTVQTANVSEGGAVVTVDALAAATDADTGTMLSVVDVPASLPAGLSYNPATHSFTLDPANAAYDYLAAGVTQTISVSYAVTDGIATTPTTISFTITGTNDAAVIGTPTLASVTEDLEAIGGNLTVTGSISISDEDADQASFKTTVSNAAGNLGALALASNGAYQYTVVNSAVQTLGAYDSKVDSFTISSADGTTRTVSFTINGVNDAAVIGEPAVTSVTEDSGVDGAGNLTAEGGISISDVDAGEANFSTTVTAVGSPLGALALASNGSYRYTVSNAATQNLGAGQTVTDTFTVTSADGTPKTVSFRISGANDAAVIGAPTVTSVTEDSGVDGAGNLTVTGSIPISDADAGQAGFGTTVTGVDSPLGILALASNGSFSYTVSNAATQSLGDEQTAIDTFMVTSVDGTVKTVSFTINGANDAPVITANYGVTTAPNTPVEGEVTAADVDGDSLTYSLDAGNAAAHGTVSLPVSGNGRYVYTPGAGYIGADGFNIIVSDDHGDTTTVAVSVNVTSGPINQNPELSGAPATLRPGIEDTAYVVAAADLLSGFTDPDGDTLSVAGLSADRGTTTDNGDGTYTIAPAANYNGPVVLSYTVVDGNGGNTRATQNFSLAPVNDPAVIGGTASGSVTEAGGTANGNPGRPTVSGTLTATDVDNPADTFQPVAAGTPGSGGYGTFGITAGGVWTYTLDNTNATVQGLNANQTLSDSFTVQTADGTPAVVDIVIAGANDAPVLAATPAISIADTAAADTFTAVPGALAAADADSGATLTFGISGGAASSALAGFDTAAAGLYGSLYVNSGSGAYSFVPDSTPINALPVATDAAETFTLTVFDGAGGTHAQALTVNVHGVNDASVISGVTGPLQYTVGQPVPSVVAPTLTLSDADSGIITHAEVAISSGLRAGNDVLTFQIPDGSPIQGLFDSGTGVLSLTGTATLAQYQAVMSSVAFSTSIIGGRTISFTVFDGTLASLTVDTSSISLESLSTSGFRIPGEIAGDNSGFSIHGAGDFDGDGFDDLIIGAPNASPRGDSYAGRSYIVFGKGAPFEPEVPLWSLDGGNGYRLSGVAAVDVSGFSVASAGDVNGDGFGDVVIGAFYSDSNGSASGASYVVFGKASGFDPDFQLSALDGTNGLRLDGAAAGDLAGISVNGAGDVNGDGYDDVLVGSYSQPSGAAYLVFGKASGFAPAIQLSALDGITGVRIAGENPHDNAGQRVHAAGDINGDGFADFIIGAPGDFRYGYDIGAAYLVFGKASYFDQATAGATLELSAVDGSNVRILGLAIDDGMGIGISSAGDINGDGFDDLIVSARKAVVDGVASGASYVVFGKADPFGRDIDLAALDGTNGFRISGRAENAWTGYSVSGVGDFNGDGFGDLIVGAPGLYGTPSWSGESYLVFGKASGFSANLDLATLGGADGARALGVANGDASGYNVSAAGDMNGDGFDDIAISSARASPHGQTAAGESYVIFGAKLVVGGETYLGGTASDTLTGTAAAESFIGGQGDDTIRGNGGNDAYSGGAGDDAMHLGATGQSAIDFIRINGGSGFDTLVLDGSAVVLDFTLPGADRVAGIERIDLAGSGDNTLKLDIRDVISMSSATNRLFVTGDAGDGVISTAQGWALSPGGPVTDQGITYASYTLGGAAYASGMPNLLIDTLLTADIS